MRDSQASGAGYGRVRAFAVAICFCGMAIGFLIFDPADDVAGSTHPQVDRTPTEIRLSAPQADYSVPADSPIHGIQIVARRAGQSQGLVIQSRQDADSVRSTPQYERPGAAVLPTISVKPPVRRVTQKGGMNFVVSEQPVSPAQQGTIVRKPGDAEALIPPPGRLDMGTRKPADGSPNWNGETPAPKRAPGKKAAVPASEGVVRSQAGADTNVATLQQGNATVLVPQPERPAPQSTERPWSIVPEKHQKPVSGGQTQGENAHPVRPQVPDRPGFAIPSEQQNPGRKATELAPHSSQPMVNWGTRHGHSLGQAHAPVERRSGPHRSGHSMQFRPGTSGFRATIESDAQRWIGPYQSRAEASSVGSPTIIPPPVPQDFEPWWQSAMAHPVSDRDSRVSVSVETLMEDALLYSPQVIAIKAEPEIRHRVITQEAAKFDWTAFLNTTYDDLNDPVSNSLMTGNDEDRLEIRKLTWQAGIRRRNMTGGETELRHQISHENQNSIFFVPNNQGATRLSLSYRQPLLNASGQAYNESRVVLARIQANSSEDEVVDALQDHLIEVTRAYWTLYRSRAALMQREKLLASTSAILRQLEARQNVDAVPRQIFRARAADAKARTAIRRAAARVRDAEAQLRLLVNSPGMLNGGAAEVLPQEAPQLVTEAADLRSMLQTALINRPDISEAIRKMRAAGVRLGVSRTELLPKLDFLVETYVADLSGSSDIGSPLRRQFVDNRPGFTVGLEFEVPLENRAARAQMEQRQWELKRAVNIFRATVEKSLTDVEIASREVRTAWSEVGSRYQSMQATETETNYLQARFDEVPEAQDNQILLLEDLVDARERLADEETAFVQAQVDHALALIKLKREIGILLQSRHARPDIQPNHQQWINERLQTMSFRNNPDQKPPVRATPAKPVAKDVPARNVSARRTGHTGIRQSSARSATEPGDGAVARAFIRPIPATPTTWSRRGANAP